MIPISIYIPKEIHVGYQNRSGTYTGKLAYVIYKDEKGALRKKASWNGWRDKSIEPDVFDNEPMEGFVLNKKAGGYTTHYNMRQTYARVYDPRGFEFEITIPNLLWILECCSTEKGKSINGRLVYSWDGKDLLLMPIDSPDYKEAMDQSKTINTSQPIKMKDLKPGATYMTRKGETYVFMERAPIYRTGYLTYPSRAEQDSSGKKVLWCCPLQTCEKIINGEDVFRPFETYTSPQSFIACIDDQPYEHYAEIYERLQSWIEYSPLQEIRQIPYTKELFQFVFSSGQVYFSDSGIMYRVYCKDDEYFVESVSWGSQANEDMLRRFDGDYYRYSPHMTFDGLYERLKPHYREYYLENGKLYARRHYYGKQE